METELSEEVIRICFFLFPFSQYVFKNFFFSWRLNLGIFGNEFNPLPRDPEFPQPRIKSISKTSWKKEKMLVTSIFSCFHNVFKLVKDIIIILAYFIFSSASSANLDRSRTLSFGKELNLLETNWRIHVLAYRSRSGCIQYSV